uniref:Secreted protein n=1 Tax=Picea glauca TaxID=3330 RepID=A0A101LWL3_PICGL|nr:hypothetical protein ABT39_MTgene1379 [Picea glauca]QHR89466.1 hypothetical protein Q903MT_gene3487 [Picea sitchensis]
MANALLLFRLCLLALLYVSSVVGSSELLDLFSTARTFSGYPGNFNLDRGTAPDRFSTARTYETRVHDRIDSTRTFS